MRWVPLPALAGLLLIGYLFVRWDSNPPQIGPLPGPYSPPTVLSERIDYTRDPAAETFLLHVPPRLDGSRPAGLIVYTSSGNDIADLPPGWRTVLDRRNIIFVAARNAGNDQPLGRRLGLAVLAARMVMARYRIDESRVFSAGLSGGARVAGQLGFYQPDLFRGSIQSCGADFPRITSDLQRRPGPDADYGLMAATGSEIERAKSFRFGIITGPGDFRHDAITDIVQHGYAADQYSARLFDVPGMGHQDADPGTLDSVLDYLEAAP